MNNTKTITTSNKTESNVPGKRTPDNLMVLNSDTGARDFNSRLQEMESELGQLNKNLDSSHQTLLKKNQKTHSEVQGSQNKLTYLESAYANLEKKSETLAQETARLTLSLNENYQQHADSVYELDISSKNNHTQVSEKIELLDKQLQQLSSDFKNLEQESQALINKVSEKTESLSESFTEHTTDFKKIADDIELRNKNVDSKLEQVGRNFSFHDAKILKLHEKDTEQKETLTALEKDFISEISSVSDETEKKYKTLTTKHKNLEKKTTQVTEKVEQIDSEVQTIEQSHQEKLSTHDERLDTHDINIESHETRLEQLKSVDEELNVRAERLKKTTERLDEHSNVLEKTTISLRNHSHELQRAVTELDKQNEQLEEKTDQLGLQIATNVQLERQHFQTMTMALSIVAVLTILGLIYSIINQQSLWQSNMDNDIVIESRINGQLYEQAVQLASVEQNLLQAEQHRGQLTENIKQLQTQLKAEQEKADDLLKASQDKNKKIVQLKGELKNIDDNVQFLNTSVGPLRDYKRNSGKQSLNDASWLTQQPESHFAIQLTSVNSKQKLYEFIDQHGYSLYDDLAWFTINSKGNDYYILTYGSFKELNQARAAMSKLPSFVTKTSPGIARIKDIQTFIR